MIRRVLTGYEVPDAELLTYPSSTESWKGSDG